MFRLLVDWEREELVLLMQERRETGQEGGCIDTIQQVTRSGINEA